YRHAQTMGEEQLLGDVEELRLRARRRGRRGHHGLALMGCTLTAVRAKVQTLFERPKGHPMPELRFDGKVAIVTGGARGLGRAYDEMPAADFDQLVDTHYGGAVRVSRAAWPHLKAAGGGRIVNMSSASVFGTPFTSPYVSSKAAIFGLTRALAAEGAYCGIMVN